jgi:hypothetical protein
MQGDFHRAGRAVVKSNLELPQSCHHRVAAETRPARGWHGGHPCSYLCGRICELGPCLNGLVRGLLSCVRCEAKNWLIFTPGRDGCRQGIS